MTECSFNCCDVNQEKHFLKLNNVNCDRIKILMISEALPKTIDDYFDGLLNPSYIVNTNFLFERNGITLEKYNDYLQKGIYLTTALKCSKKEYLVSSETIKNCSVHLEKEIELFPNLKTVLLMGDFAIKSINYIWKRKYNIRVIPNGSTYKIRNEEYVSNGIRFIPSYTQTGDSFGIEKSKIAMMIEDIGKVKEIIK